MIGAIQIITNHYIKSEVLQPITSNHKPSVMDNAGHNHKMCYIVDSATMSKILQEI
jgi:hypothetical protein